MQLCGLYSGTGAATLAIERSSVTKEHSVCRTPIHLVTRQNQDTRSITFRSKSPGRLTSVAYAATEAVPHGISIDPTERYLFVTTLETGRLASFRVDLESGKLEPLEYHDVGKYPMWVLATSVKG